MFINRKIKGIKGGGEKKYRFKKLIRVQLSFFFFENLKSKQNQRNIFCFVANRTSTVVYNYVKTKIFEFQIKNFSTLRVPTPLRPR